MTTTKMTANILFANDSVSEREYIKNILETALPGCNVVCVNDGADVLPILQDYPEGYFDILLLDNFMKKLDGPNCLYNLIHSDIKIPPCIFITNHPEHLQSILDHIPNCNTPIFLKDSKGYDEVIEAIKESTGFRQVELETKFADSNNANCMLAS